MAVLLFVLLGFFLSVYWIAGFVLGIMGVTVVSTNKYGSCPHGVFTLVRNILLLCD